MDNNPPTAPQVSVSPEQLPPAENPQAPVPSSPEKKGMSKKKRNMIIVAAIVSLLVVSLVAFFVIRNSQQPAVVEPPDSSQDDQQNITALDRFVAPQTGEEWYEVPDQIETLELFKDDANVTYRMVGKREDNDIIHTFVRLEDGTDRNHMLFERSQSGAITAILRPQGYDAFTKSRIAEIQSQFSDKVTAYDTALNYDSLSLPRSIDLGDNQRIDRINDEGLGVFPVVSAAENTRQLLDTFGASKLFVLKQFDEKYQLTHARYQIETPLQTRMTVRYFPQDTTVASYTWENGKVPRVIDLNGLPIVDQIAPFSSGCELGGVRSTILDKLDNADIIVGGTTKDGSTVYKLADSKHPLVTFVYTGYREEAESQRQTVDSLADFLNFHGIVILKNTKGQSFLYVRDHYLSRYQCR